MSKVSEADLKDYEAKYRRVAHLISSESSSDGEPVWEVVLRCPKREEYKRYRSQCHNPAMIADAQETLVRALMVYPTGDAITALIEDWPGIPEACGGALAKLAGISGAESGK